MGDRSSSGVRGIRAMFEAKTENTSPPSRGRSPVGSDRARSTSSRPISKVRASFIAVERSGLLGPQLGLRKMSDTGDSTVNNIGAGEAKAAIPKAVSFQWGEIEAVEPMESPNAHGNQLSTDMEKVDSTKITKEDPTNVDGARDTVATVDTKAPTDAATPPEDGIGNKHAHLATAEQSTIEDLGNVLKGSPFEPGVNTVLSHSVTHAPLSPSKATKQPVDQGKSKHTSGDTFQADTDLKPDSKGKSPRLSAISTKHDHQSDRKNVQSLSSDKAVKHVKSSSPKAPTALGQPSSSNNPHPRQALVKTASPKQPTSAKFNTKAVPGDTNKAPVKKPSRISLATTSIKTETKTRQSSASAHGPSLKKIVPTVSSRQSSAAFSTTSAPDIKKPKAKSPTRPTRLPAAATAPTAASIAKLGETGTHPRSPSRSSAVATQIDQNVATQNKDRPKFHSRGQAAAGAAHSLARKSSRPSLPAGSNLADRPKSRASTIGSKALDEGFLTRMMRPTASSASKTHEKIEPKSPPRKGSAPKPKRKSGGSDEKSILVDDEHKSAADHGAATAGTATDKMVPTSNHISITNGASKAVSAGSGVQSDGQVSVESTKAEGEQDAAHTGQAIPV
ncbi:hypothetical protein MMC19_000858 [Ptychographa xylographoides]|nr:hypothetical protein [Ptychographa xylographoides]